MRAGYIKMVTNKKEKTPPKGRGEKEIKKCNELREKLG
jgi:hypothetical protein